MRAFLSSWVSTPLRYAIVIGAVLVMVLSVGQAATAMYVGGRAIGASAGVTVYDFLPGIADGWNGAKEESKEIRAAYKAKAEKG